jgi:hypothetical protein
LDFRSCLLCTVEPVQVKRGLIFSIGQQHSWSLNVPESLVPTGGVGGSRVSGVVAGRELNSLGFLFVTAHLVGVWLRPAYSVPLDRRGYS